MLPYFKELPYALNDTTADKLLALSLDLHATHRNSTVHLFKREYAEKHKAPGKWYMDDSTETLREIKSITESILKCINIPYRSFDQFHAPCILYAPAGSKLATHVDHPDENFNVELQGNDGIGRSAALSIPLNYGVEEDPTVFYEYSNPNSEAARCYYERKKLCIINTFAYHGTNILKNERYTFQISFDLDMYSDFDFDSIITTNLDSGPLINLK